MSLVDCLILLILLLVVSMIILFSYLQIKNKKNNQKVEYDKLTIKQKNIDKLFKDKIISKILEDATKNINISKMDMMFKKGDRKFVNKKYSNLNTEREIYKQVNRELVECAINIRLEDLKLNNDEFKNLLIDDKSIYGVSGGYILSLYICKISKILISQKEKEDDIIENQKKAYIEKEAEELIKNLTN